MRETLIAQGGAWQLRVQLRTGLETMPIEDTSVAWDEKESAYRTAVRINVAPQLPICTDLSSSADETPSSALGTASRPISHLVP